MLEAPSQSLYPEASHFDSHLNPFLFLTFTKPTHLMPISLAASATSQEDTQGKSLNNPGSRCLSRPLHLRALLELKVS